MAMPPLTPQGTMRVPLTTLTQLLAQGKRVVGVSVTPASHEVVAVGPPTYQLAAVLNSGSSLTPEQLKVLVDQQQAGALVLGGSALFRADGSTHYGVRKLISAVMGLSYQSGEALPTPLWQQQQGWQQQGWQQQQQQHRRQPQWGLSGGAQASAPYRPFHLQQQLQQQWGAQGASAAPTHYQQQQQQYQAPRYPHQHQHPSHPQTPQQRWHPGGGQMASFGHEQSLHQQQHVITPILLCRENVDDAGAMLTRYIKRHSSAAFPSMNWDRWTSAF